MLRFFTATFGPRCAALGLESKPAPQLIKEDEEKGSNPNALQYWLQ